MRNYIALMGSIILYAHVGASEKEHETFRDEIQSYFKAYRRTIHDRLDRFHQKSDLQADDYKNIDGLLSSDVIRSIENMDPMEINIELLPSRLKIMKPNAIQDLLNRTNSDGCKLSGNGKFSWVPQWMKRK
jgi:hypothetical protein